MDFDYKISRQKIPLRNCAFASQMTLRLVGPFGAWSGWAFPGYPGGSWAMKRVGGGGMEKVGVEGEVLVSGILGAFALGGFSFPCPSLTFTGHCNSIFWAGDSELE